jgi:predicted N-acetyltransferase YhbS
VSAQASEDPVSVELERPGDAAAVEALVDAAFGPGRYAKTAERLREGRAPQPGLGFVALEAGGVIGTVRLWPILIGGTEACFLGPIAVEGGRRREGLGALLVERALDAAEAADFPAVLLVGDPYFTRFGFEKADVRMPGPVDPRRVLIKVLRDGEAPKGAVEPA